MGDPEPAASESPCDELIDTLRLAWVPGVGPRLRRELLERFGSSRAVLAAPSSELREVRGIGPRLAREILAAKDPSDVQAELALCRQHGAEVLTERDAAYPRLLCEIEDPPPALFITGSLKPQDALAVAIVGTRHATQYGLRQAERLAAALVRAGLTIVSGLARGIDAAAHRGALEAGGRTLAVLGSGILNIYPPENRKLADRVAQNGALLSEEPPRAPALAGVFPKRNRIISGLSLGTVVVEAPQRSGALITARLAAEQGREVFAVPGRADSRASRGCHRLIRDGAKLVETADDVLEELGPLVQPTPRGDASPECSDPAPLVRHPAELLLNETEQKVLSAVEPESTSIDQLVARTGLPVSQVLSTLSVLEMRRLVRRLSGSTVARA